MDIAISAPVHSDPDLKIGGILVLERADGRSVWRQRLVVSEKTERGYVMRPVEDTYHG